ncbi:protein goliath-like isoform X2 [Colias croceus]|uniref:protein goliath-like isoform X2 n=1 Tax=Colias crocea TaxID=72248 RepID=UPI001E27D84F|nr:protein goliath-like isoform X2 [Colias croceus]
MRAEDLWSGLALSWVVTLVGCHSPGSELESVRYGPGDERFTSDTYTIANINITYEDEHGEIFNDTSEVRKTHFASQFTGKYGEGYIGSARGMAVHVRARGPDGEHDHTGCKWPLLSVAAPHDPLPSEPWIAVIRRGSCNFEIKVQNAWRANASAVLIYNDRDTTLLEKMKLSTDSGRNISAVFIYKWKGEEITKLVDNGTRVMVAIIKGRTFTHINNNINKTSVLFVSISFIVLMVISLAWLVFYYIQRFRYIHAKDRLSKRLCCAAKKALSKIPVKSLKTDDREVQGDGECCAICIEPYRVSETLRSLPCRHDFHKNCIDPWLLEHRTCPMCKMDILKYYGFVFTGSQESILQLDVEEARSRALSPALSPARTRHPLTLLSSDSGFAASARGGGDSARSSRAASPDQLVRRDDLQHGPDNEDSPSEQNEDCSPEESSGSGPSD